ncbi:myosin heavy [Cyclospora cayetanensis]|uniref:Myosin heavy n=1 Tax=Cyclospora cayetanensis TaxID=88456 RepID=A0A1D3D2V4_9EIME|nr:myosin heavy [Cyclospora cayetanensis]
MRFLHVALSVGLAVTGCLRVEIGCQWVAAAASRDNPEDLTVSRFASQLAVKADAASLVAWQQDVEDSLQQFRHQLKSDYPLPPTPESLHTNAIFSLREAPGERFRYVSHVTPRIFDFFSIDTKKKRMVEADIFYTEARVLHDPVRDAEKMAERAENIMLHLQNKQSQLRALIDTRSTDSSSAMLTLQKGVGDMNLEQLQTFESKATEELEAARKVVEDLERADAETVKQTTQAGRLLHEARAGILQSGKEANSLRKGLQRLGIQFQHLVASSGVELQSSVDYMKRAQEVLSNLTKSYNAGMSELKRKKAILERMAEAMKIPTLFEEVMRRLRYSQAAIDKVMKSAPSAEEKGNMLKLQELMVRLDEERAKIREAGKEGNALITDMAATEARLNAAIDQATSKAMKDEGQVHLQKVQDQLVGMRSSLTENLKKAESLLSSATSEISNHLENCLEFCKTAIESSEAWLKQAVEQQKNLRKTLVTKQEEAAAAQNAARQLKRVLLEDIADVQSKLASGAADAIQLEAQYSLNAHKDTAEALLLKADEAVKRIEIEAANVQAHAASVYDKVKETLHTLSSSEKLASELASKAKEQQKALLEQNLQGKEAVEAASEAEKAGRRSATASMLADRSSSLSNALTMQVEEMKAAMKTIDDSLVSMQGSNTDEAQKAEEAALTAKELKKYQDQAVDNITEADKYLTQAKQTKAQMNLAEDKLSKLIKEFHEALKQNSIELVLKDFGGDSTAKSPAGKEDSTQGGPYPAGSGEPSRLVSLGASVQQDVGQLLNFASEMMKWADESEKAQQQALWDYTNLRLSSLKASLETGDGAAWEGKEGQHSGAEGDLLPTTVIKKIKQNPTELLEFRNQGGGIAAIRDVVDGVLQQLFSILSLAEGRLTDLLNIGVPELEKHMASAQTAAEELYKEKAEAAAADKIEDHDSALAVAFASCVQRARQLATGLHVVADEVESCSRDVGSTLKELKTFRSLHSLTPSEVATETMQTSRVRSLLSTSDSSVAIRRLSEISSSDISIPSLDEMARLSEDLAARAADAKNGLVNRVAHLKALSESGVNDPAPLPETGYIDPLPIPSSSAPQQPEKSTHGTPPGGSSSGKNDKKGGISNPTVFLAVGVAGAILLFVALSFCGLYAYKKRQKRLSCRKQVDSSSDQMRNKPPDAPGDSVVCKPTFGLYKISLEMDDPGMQAHMQQVNSRANAGEGARGLIPAVVSVPAREISMGDLETGKIDTTKKQYFIDEHHLVARELSKIQPSRCRTPLAFVVSSTPVDAEPPGPTSATTGVRTPRLWESDHTEESVQGRSASPSVEHHRQEPNDEQQQEQSGAEELRELEGEMELNLETPVDDETPRS